MEINAAPYIGIIGAVVMWFGLIFTLLVLKGFVVQGTAMAIAEWLLKIGDRGSQERICRWLGDKELIMQQLQKIEETQQK